VEDDLLEQEDVGEEGEEEDEEGQSRVFRNA
jgi:hypothetical protein